MKLYREKQGANKPYLELMEITEEGIMNLMHHECLVLGTLPQCGPSLKYLAKAIINKLKGE